MTMQGWELPAAKAVWKNRSNINSAMDKLVGILFGKKTRIAFAGSSGIGKSVLADYLTGIAYEKGYEPPSKSESAEHGKILAKRKRIRTIVIPGQASETKSNIEQAIFAGNNPVDGVVYVVSNGFVHLREQDALEHHQESPKANTLSKFRDIYRQREIEDFRELAQTIRGAHRKARRPSWMIIAPTKLDLYYDEIAEAHDYYLADPNSPFVKEVRRLERQVGSDNFRWGTVPVCGWLEGFSYNTEEAKSTLSVQQRDHYVAAFAEMMENFCER